MTEAQGEVIPMPPVPSEYEERFVAFLDILGWRELVKASEADGTLIPVLGQGLNFLHMIGSVVPNLMKEDARQRGRPFVRKTEFSQFSDCIVISAETDRINHHLFVDQAISISRGLFHLGLPARGGITKGLMYHQGSIAFGPALTAAYNLEQKAIYPRIIVDRDLEQFFLESQRWFSEGRALDFQLVRRAPDGFLFLDFLLPQNTLRGENLPADQQPSQAVLQQTIAPARDVIVAGLEEHLYKPQIWEKYRWLADYFNEIALQYPQADLQPIPRMPAKATSATANAV